MYALYDGYVSDQGTAEADVGPYHPSNYGKTAISTYLSPALPALVFLARSLEAWLTGMEEKLAWHCSAFWKSPSIVWKKSKTCESYCSVGY